MNEHKLSGIQKIFKAIFPASWGAAMEAESRQWMVHCPNCGFERSIWELGGIRWKTAGNQKQLVASPNKRSGRAYSVNRSNQKQFAVCPNCKERGWHPIYKKENQ